MELRDMRKKRKNATSYSELVCHMHMLEVDGQLLSVVTDDQAPNSTRPFSESFLHLVDEIALINHLQALLDLTSLGHANEPSIITDINEPILLEDWSQEGMENNGWRWVRNNTWLLVELLGEEVHTEVSVLTGLSGGGDTDDLARTVLEYDQVTNANMVARDSEGSG